MAKFNIGDKVKVKANIPKHRCETGTIIVDPFLTHGGSGPIQEDGTLPETTEHITYKVRIDSTQKEETLREEWLELVE